MDLCPVEAATWGVAGCVCWGSEEQANAFASTEVFVFEGMIFVVEGQIVSALHIGIVYRDKVLHDSSERLSASASV